MSSRIPILVGQAQLTNRLQSLKDFIHPVQMMKQVIEAAAEDANCPALVSKADSLHIVNLFSWTLPDFPSAVAEALNIHPSVKEYTSIGGNTPQWLVNRAADQLASGKSEIVLLAGCEVMRSVHLAHKEKKDLGNFGEANLIEWIGGDLPGSNEVENDHLANLPIRIYPLIENALRYKEKLSIEQQRENLGKFGETYSAVAAKNRYAWFPIKRTAEEIVTPTAMNRMISFPYTKYMNAVLEVDQAAAVILTTTAKAKELGIPESQWVYLHGGQDAHDRWFISEREDLADSPALKAIVRDALSQANLTLDQIDFFDFYSCFPCMPRLSRHVLGISQEDKRPMTVTGGLPYFGGPGSNYTMHAIAEVMKLCRSNPNLFGMVTSNGWYSTKHGVGIYSTSPPSKTWQRTNPSDFQRNLSLPKAVEIDFEPQGEFSVESYTVWHNRNGEPETGIFFGRTENGKRAWAHLLEEEKELLQKIMKEEWIGKVGKIVGQYERINLIEF